MAVTPDPLIAAVLKKIPGADATREQRLSWLRMVAMAMDNVHGQVGEPIEIPDFLGPRPAADDSSAAASTIAPLARGSNPLPPLLPAGSKPQIVRKVDPPRFFIDREGVARKDPGRIPATFEEANGDIWFDERGEGDLGSIRWADGTRGVLGKSIEISAVLDKKAG